MLERAGGGGLGATPSARERAAQRALQDARATAVRGSVPESYHQKRSGRTYGRSRASSHVDARTNGRRRMRHMDYDAQADTLARSGGGERPRRSSSGDGRRGSGRRSSALGSLETLEARIAALEGAGFGSSPPPSAPSTAPSSRPRSSTSPEARQALTRASLDERQSSSGEMYASRRRSDRSRERLAASRSRSPAGRVEGRSPAARAEGRSPAAYVEGRSPPSVRRTPSPRAVSGNGSGHPVPSSPPQRALPEHTSTTVAAPVHDHGLSVEAFAQVSKLIADGQARYRSEFEARLDALEDAHAATTRRLWAELENLREVVRDSAEESRVAIKDLDVLLKSEMLQTTEFVEAQMRKVAASRADGASTSSGSTAAAAAPAEAVEDGAAPQGATQTDFALARLVHHVSQVEAELRGELAAATTARSEAAESLQAKVDEVKAKLEAHEAENGRQVAALQGTASSTFADVGKITARLDEIDANTESAFRKTQEVLAALDSRQREVAEIVRRWVDAFRSVESALPTLQSEVAGVVRSVCDVRDDLTSATARTSYLEGAVATRMKELEDFVRAQQPTPSHEPSRSPDDVLIAAKRTVDDRASELQDEIEALRKLCVTRTAELRQELESGCVRPAQLQRALDRRDRNLLGDMERLASSWADSRLNEIRHKIGKLEHRVAGVAARSAISPRGSPYVPRRGSAGTPELTRSGSAQSGSSGDEAPHAGKPPRPARRTSAGASDSAPLIGRDSHSDSPPGVDRHRSSPPLLTDGESSAADGESPAMGRSPEPSYSAIPDEQPDEAAPDQPLPQALQRDSTTRSSAGQRVGVVDGALEQKEVKSPASSPLLSHGADHASESAFDPPTQVARARTSSPPADADVLQAKDPQLESVQAIDAGDDRDPGADGAAEVPQASAAGSAPAADDTLPELSHEDSMPQVVSSPFDPVDRPRSSLTSYLLRRAAAHGDATAIVAPPLEVHESAMPDISEWPSLTFREFAEEVRLVGAGLARGGFKKGDVLALVAPNCVFYPVVFHAAVALGGVVAPSPADHTIDLLADQFSVSHPRVVVCAPRALDGVVAALNMARVRSQVVLMDDCPPSKGSPRNDPSSFPTLSSITKGGVEGFPTKIRFSPRKDAVMLLYRYPLSRQLLYKRRRSKAEQTQELAEAVARMEHGETKEIVVPPPEPPLSAEESSVDPTIKSAPVLDVRGRVLVITHANVVACLSGAEAACSAPAVTRVRRLMSELIGNGEDGSSAGSDDGADVDVDGRPGVYGPADTVLCSAQFGSAEGIIWGLHLPMLLGSRLVAAPHQYLSATAGLRQLVARCRPSVYVTETLSSVPFAPSIKQVVHLVSLSEPRTHRAVSRQPTPGVLNDMGSVLVARVAGCEELCASGFVLHARFQELSRIDEYVRARAELPETRLPRVCAALGVLVPNLQSKLMHPVENRPVGNNSVGELCICSPYLARGVVGSDGQVTALRLDREAFMPTGHIVMCAVSGIFYVWSTSSRSSTASLSGTPTTVGSPAPGAVEAPDGSTGKGGAGGGAMSPSRQARPAPDDEPPSSGKREIPSSVTPKESSPPPQATAPASAAGKRATSRRKPASAVEFTSPVGVTASDEWPSTDGEPWPGRDEVHSGWSVVGTPAARGQHVAATPGSAAPAGAASTPAVATPDGDDWGVSDPTWEPDFGNAADSAVAADAEGGGGEWEPDFS